MQKSNRRRTIFKPSRRLVFAALISVFVIAGAIAAINLMITERNYTVAQDEYDDLRQFAPATQATAAEPQQPVTDPEDEDEDDLKEEPAIEIMPNLVEFNPDYIGWIRIYGTQIDYPVVRGPDNDKYLNTTFRGGRNPSGTIFMDYRCVEGFSNFAILHGHNMKNGSMFSGLHNFRESGFLDTYNEIIIFTHYEEMLIYRIIDVFITDMSDEIFSLPEMEKHDIDTYFAQMNIQDSANILVLSTCTAGHRDERLLVIAER